MAVFALLGAGGLAREVMPAVSHSIAATPSLSIEPSAIYFVDRQPASPIRGHAVLAEDEFLALPDPVKY